MKGDFTRDTFSRLAHYSQVLMQQGRVQLDADWNEQSAIIQHYFRGLARDLIGPRGGPARNCGFAIIFNEADLSRSDREMLQQKNLLPPGPGDFFINPGIYYVQGIMCESESGTLYTRQPDLNTEALPINAGQKYLVYLDVWEQHLSSLEVPALREVALGGPDTTTRSKVIWQVKVLKIDNAGVQIESDESLYPAVYLELLLRQDGSYIQDDFQKNADIIVELKARIESLKSARLGVRLNELNPPSAPAVSSAAASYRGLENQLYRIEIHRSGPVGKATFKWSRDNGAIAFIVTSGLDQAGSSDSNSRTIVTLDHFEQSGPYSLEVGDWVEVVRASDALDGSLTSLVRVQAVDFPYLSVTLEGVVPPGNGSEYTLLRRWDQTATNGNSLEDGAIRVVEDSWIDLEDGVQINFKKAATPVDSTYYTAGDYWQVPARVASGNIQWPTVDGQPVFLEALGVTHHYAPLAVIGFDDNNQLESIAELRFVFESLSKQLS